MGCPLPNRGILGYGQELPLRDCDICKGVEEVWRPRTMSLVVKQIRTWNKSNEDFNKGTFVLDLKTGSLWIYLQGKQGLLNGQCLGVKEHHTDHFSREHSREN